MLKRFSKRDDDDDNPRSDSPKTPDEKGTQGWYNPRKRGDDDPDEAQNERNDWSYIRNRYNTAQPGSGASAKKEASGAKDASKSGGWNTWGRKKTDDPEPPAWSASASSKKGSQDKDESSSRFKLPWGGKGSEDKSAKKDSASGSKQPFRDETRRRAGPFSTERSKPIGADDAGNTSDPWGDRLKSSSYYDRDRGAEDKPSWQQRTGSAAAPKSAGNKPPTWSRPGDKKEDEYASGNKPSWQQRPDDRWGQQSQSQTSSRWGTTSQQSTGDTGSSYSTGSKWGQTERPGSASRPSYFNSGARTDDKPTAKPEEKRKSSGVGGILPKWGSKDKSKGADKPAQPGGTGPLSPEADALLRKRRAEAAAEAARQRKESIMGGGQPPSQGSANRPLSPEAEALLRKRRAEAAAADQAMRDRKQSGGRNAAAGVAVPKDTRTTSKEKSRGGLFGSRAKPEEKKPSRAAASAKAKPAPPPSRQKSVPDKKAPRARPLAHPLPDQKDRSALSIHQGLDFDRKIDLVGVLLFGLAFVSFFSVLPSMSFGILPEPQSGLTGSLNHLLSQLFGWGKVVVPLAVGAVGIWLMMRSFEESGIELDYIRLVGLLMLFAGGLTWVQMIQLVDDTAPTVEAFRPLSYALAVDQGQGGGWIGHQIYIFLLSQFLDWGTLSVLVAWLVMGLMLTFDLSVVEIWGYVLVVLGWFGLRRRGAKRAAQAIAEAENLPVTRPGETPAALAMEAAPAGSAAAPPVSEPHYPNPAQPPVRPVINRPGQPDSAGAMAMSAPSGTAPSATAPPGSAAPAAESLAVDDPNQDERKPVRRRIPHFRRDKTVPGMEGSEEDETAANGTDTQAAGEEAARSRRGLWGRLRGKGQETEDGEDQPAAGKAAPAPAGGSQANARTVPDIPVPPRRSSPDATAAPAKSDESASESDAARGGLNPFSKLNRVRTGSKPEPDTEKEAEPKTEKNSASIGETGKPVGPDTGSRPDPARRSPSWLASAAAGAAALDSLRQSASSEETPARSTPPTESRPEERWSTGSAARRDPLRDPFAPPPGKEADKGKDPAPSSRIPTGTPMGAPATGRPESWSAFRRPDPSETHPPTEPEKTGPTPRASNPAGPGADAVGSRALPGDMQRQRTPGASPFEAEPPRRDPPAKPSSLAVDDDDDEPADRVMTGRDAAATAPKPAAPLDAVGNRALPGDMLRRTPGASPFEAEPPRRDPPAKPSSLAADDDDDEPAEKAAPAPPDSLGSRALPGDVLRRRTPGASPFAAASSPADNEALDDESDIDEFDDDLDLDLDLDDDDDMDTLGDTVPIARTERPAPLINRRGTGPLTPRTPVPPVIKGDKAGESRRDDDGGAEEVGTVRADAAPAPVQEPPAQPRGIVLPSRPQPEQATRPITPIPIRPASAEETTPAARDESLHTQPEAPRSPGWGARGPAVAMGTGQGTPDTRAAARPTPGKVKYDLPDYRKLLRQGEDRSINDEVLLDKARVIEDTLASFGAPGKVVEVNPGPVITQFGVEPDYLLMRSGKKQRVKVGQIARLDADLALALAARSIRIEAPVPGKGFVGIEVPNDDVALVGLLDIMESPEFQRINSKLRIALGLAVDGSPVAADLTAMPHLLIAGTTGSGKSVCVNAIISCLLLSNTPDEVQFIMVDPKRVELTGYNGIPHLVAPVVVDLERIVGVLQWVQREMEERYRKFAAISARNILDYNGKLSPDQAKMPYYVVVVDELADLMMLAPDETERLLARLAQMARATGIHLIISTQRPSVDIITGLIKANFPARIAFAVASSVDSRVILDQPGAEKLLGRGDMLYQSPDAAAPLRMQGVYVSDEEINALTRYWKGLMLDKADADGGRGALVSPNRDVSFESVPIGSGAGSARKASRPAQQPTFWDDDGRVAGGSGSSSDDDEGGVDDELYDQAVELVQRLQKASISLLQRRLRIGYTRAARLIDIMEAEGIVGPAESGSKPREVLKARREGGD